MINYKYDLLYIHFHYFFHLTHNTIMATSLVGSTSGSFRFPVANRSRSCVCGLPRASPSRADHSTVVYQRVNNEMFGILFWHSVSFENILLSSSIHRIIAVLYWWFFRISHVMGFFSIRKTVRTTVPDGLNKYLDSHTLLLSFPVRIIIRHILGAPELVSRSYFVQWTPPFVRACVYVYPGVRVCVRVSVCN